MNRRNVVLLVVAALLVGAIVVKYRDTEPVYSTDDVVSALEAAFDREVRVVQAPGTAAGEGLEACDAVQVDGLSSPVPDAIELRVCPGGRSGFLDEEPSAAWRRGGAECPSAEQAGGSIVDELLFIRRYGHNVVLLDRACQPGPNPSAEYDALAAALDEHLGRSARDRE